MTAATKSEMDWYEAGLLHGIEIGRRQAEQEAIAQWQQMRDTVLPYAIAGIERASGQRGVVPGVAA